MPKTTRQRIRELLERESLGPTDLAARLDLPLKEVVDHLNHVRRSVRPPQRFLVEPAACESCGFVFKDRRKLGTPGRCPKCKSELIREMTYHIK